MPVLPESQTKLVVEWAIATISTFICLVIGSSELYTTLKILEPSHYIGLLKSKTYESAWYTARNLQRIQLASRLVVKSLNYNQTSLGTLV